MRSIEAVVTDLEWQRLRRRVGGHPNALFARCRAWAVLELLKLITRAPVSSDLLDLVARPVYFSEACNSTSSTIPRPSVALPQRWPPKS